MTNRRGFLGSVLGSFAALPILDWVARDIQSKEIIEQPKILYPQFKTAVKLTNGKIIQGPAIKIIEVEESSVAIRFHDINLKTIFKGKGQQIYTDRGKLLFDGDWYYEQFAQSGDTLKLTYCLHPENISARDIVDKIHDDPYFLEKVKLEKRLK